MTRFFFLATLFAVTFEKIHWNVAGQVDLADLVAIGFIVSYTADRVIRGDARLPRTSAIVGAFFLTFLLVYLIGYFNLESAVAAAQYAKGFVKFGIHWLFLLLGVAYLARGTRRFYWQAFGVFVAGIVFNAVYGIIQLLAARSGFSIDSAVLSPLTGGASSINLYGAIEGVEVYRINALTGDPNHLGVMLIVPLLSLTPVYLRMERGHPLKRVLALTLAFLLVIEVATLSRSGMLGLGVGALILVLPYRHLVLTRALLVPLGAVVALLGLVVLSRYAYFSQVIRSRFDTGGTATSAHFGVYDFIPDVLSRHPLFGLGLNNFSVYYEEVTGKTNWGPHSFYVALFVETGIVGAALFAVFLAYAFARMTAGRRVGRALAAEGDRAALRIIPLSWGMTAALAGTLVANLFYLTMPFYYVYVFLVFALALPIVFGRELASQPAAAPARQRAARPAVARSPAG